jgi:hypothetical protein
MTNKAHPLKCRTQQLHLHSTHQLKPKTLSPLLSVHNHAPYVQYAAQITNAVI